VGSLSPLQTAEDSTQPFNSQISLPYYLNQCADIFQVPGLAPDVEYINDFYGGNQIVTSNTVFIVSRLALRGESAAHSRDLFGWNFECFLTFLTCFCVFFLRRMEQSTRGTSSVTTRRISRARAPSLCCQFALEMVDLLCFGGPEAERESWMFVCAWKGCSPLLVCCAVLQDHRNGALCWSVSSPAAGLELLSRHSDSHSLLALCLSSSDLYSPQPDDLPALTAARAEANAQIALWLMAPNPLETEEAKSTVEKATEKIVLKEF
jgi:hypothetical protein